MIRTTTGLMILLAVAACEAPKPAEAPAPASPVATIPPAAPIAAAPTVAADRLVGRWTGPEGLFLQIGPDGNGGYTVNNRWSLDDEGKFTGRAATDGIVIERASGMVLLRAGTGAETGMKYLLDKQDCIVAGPGEGYCRD